MKNNFCYFVILLFSQFSQFSRIPRDLIFIQDMDTDKTTFLLYVDKVLEFASFYD
jgi:hypothetical protein